MYVIKTARSVMLGITIDNKLNLDGNIRKICKKYGQKLNDFSRIPTFPNDQKGTFLLPYLNVFFTTI